MLHVLLFAVIILIGSAIAIFLPIILWESHLPFSKPEASQPEHQVSEDD